MKIKFSDNKSLNVTNNNIVTMLTENSSYRGTRMLLNKFTKKGLYYYEITIVKLINIIIFGVCDETQEMDNIVRYRDLSKVYALDTLGEMINKGLYNTEIRDGLHEGDTIGVIINFDENELSFIYNDSVYLLGKNLWEKNNNISPCVFLTKENEKVIFNFGNRKFKYQYPSNSNFFITGNYFLRNQNKLYSLNDNNLNTLSFQYESINELDKRNSFKNINKLINNVNYIQVNPKEKPELQNGKYKFYSIQFNQNLENVFIPKQDFNDNKIIKPFLPVFDKVYECNGYKISTNSDYGSGYGLYNAFDNIPGWSENEYFSSKFLGEHNEVEIIIEFPELINVVRLQMEIYFLNTDYKIQSSINGKDYVNLVENGNNENNLVIENFELTNKSKYIKIILSCNRDYIYVNNIKLFKINESDIKYYTIRKDNQYYDFINKKWISEINTENFPNNLVTDSKYINDFLNNDSGINKSEELLIITQSDISNEEYTFNLIKSFKPINQFKGEIEIISLITNKENDI